MHLFEFGDLTLLPDFLRGLLHRVLRFAMSKPFRTYYIDVAKSAHDYVVKHQIDHVIELGAGDAPLTRYWLKLDGDYRITVTDIFLHPEKINDLKALNSERVTILEESIDFTKKQDWSENSLLVLSASFHHVPKLDREAILANFKPASVLISEPLSNNLASYVFSFFTFVPALIYPTSKLSFTDRLTAILWCWLIPIVPILLTWDGLVSCLRQWRKKKWLLVIEKTSKKTGMEYYKSDGIQQQILLCGGNGAA